MQVDIFSGQGRVFGCVESGQGDRLPAKFGPWNLFKTIGMERGDHQRGVDVEECLDDIAAHGFHLTDAHVRITEQALPPQ